MKNKLRKIELEFILNPSTATFEQVAHAILFGNRNEIVDDTIWEELLIEHLMHYKYN
jgi:hypothetical protein